MITHDNKNGACSCGAWHTEKDFCANCGVQVDPKHAEWGLCYECFSKEADRIFKDTGYMI